MIWKKHERNFEQGLESMSVQELSKRIADTQRRAYIIAVFAGMVPYIFLLYSYDWNPLSILVGEFAIGLSAFGGVFMRFISGLGITLTYTTFCAFIFTVFAPYLKRHKTRAKLVYTLILLITLVPILYAFDKIGNVTFNMSGISFLDLLLTIAGVWSLVVLVYLIPVMRNEYDPVLDQKGTTRVKAKLGNWRFSFLRGYRERISRDYGRVYESDFQRYGARMSGIRHLLSGLILLPITLSLVALTPIATVAFTLWIRMLSLNHKHFSNLERGLILLTTLSVVLLATFTFSQTGLVGLRVVFDISYGFGLLSGIILLFLLMI
jgi:hypothetical protein